MPNETIGKIKCPLAGDWAEVRKDKRGKFYYVGEAGMIKPNLPAGQEWLLNAAVMFGEKERQTVNEEKPDFGRRFKNDAAFQEPQDDSGWSPL